MTMNGSNGTQNGSPLQAIVMSPADALSQFRPVSPGVYFDREKLREWIADKASPTQGKYQCVTFTLSHCEKQSGWYCITPAFTPKSMTDVQRSEAIDRMLADFERTAITIAAPYGKTPQLFKVGAHLTDKRDREAEYCTTFLMKGSDDFIEPFTGENTDTQAIIGNYQRTQETLIRQFTGAMTQVFQQYGDDNRQYRHEFREMMDRQIQMSKELEEARDAKHLRGIEAARKQMEFDITAAAVQQAVKYLMPVVAGAAQKITGVEPPAEHPVASLVRTLEPRELVGIYALLSPEKRAQFMPVVQSLSADMPEEKRNELIQMFMAGGPTDEGGMK